MSRRTMRAWSGRNAFGVSFIFKSMDQGPTFLSRMPNEDPHDRILKRTRTRYTHYYFQQSMDSIRSRTADPRSDMLPRQHVNSAVRGYVVPRWNVTDCQNETLL
jgi:hypothetical protein